MTKEYIKTKFCIHNNHLKMMSNKDVLRYKSILKNKNAFNITINYVYYDIERVVIKQIDIVYYLRNNGNKELIIETLHKFE